MTDEQRTYRLRVEQNAKRLLDLMRVNSVLPVVCIEGTDAPHVGVDPKGERAIIFCVEVEDYNTFDTGYVPDITCTDNAPEV